MWDSSIKSIQLDLQEVPDANQSISEWNEDSGDDATDKSKSFNEDKNTGTQWSSKKIWYDRLTLMIDHIHDASQEFIFVLVRPSSKS